MPPSSTPVTVTINVTRRDFYGLQVRYLARKQWWLPLALGITLYGAAGFNAMAVVAGAIIGASLIPLGPVMQWRSAKKHNPNFGAATVYTFSDTGILLEWPVTSVRYDWAAIKRCTQTEKYLLIHFSPEWFYFIPKRELTASELNGITDILHTHPPAEKRLEKGR